MTLEELQSTKLGSNYWWCSKSLSLKHSYHTIVVALCDSMAMRKELSNGLRRRHLRTMEGYCLRSNLGVPRTITSPYMRTLWLPHAYTQSLRTQSHWWALTGFQVNDMKFKAVAIIFAYWLRAHRRTLTFALPPSHLVRWWTWSEGLRTHRRTLHIHLRT